VAEDPKPHELGNTQSYHHEQTRHIHTPALKKVECQWQDEYGDDNSHLRCHGSIQRAGVIKAVVLLDA